MIKSKPNLTIEDQENDFTYRKKKTGVNIHFNRVAFIFFIFLGILLLLIIVTTSKSLLI